MLQGALEKIACFGRSSSFEKDLDPDKLGKLRELRERGFLTFSHLVGTDELKNLQEAYRKKVEIDLDFEFPCLAQSKIDADIHSDLIKRNFLATTGGTCRSRHHLFKRRYN